MVEQGLLLYLKEVEQHLSQYCRELDHLAQLEQLGIYEYRAAERLLQLLTEVAIGLAKHWLKAVSQSSAAEAYQTFLQLEKQQLISSAELSEWRKIIGLRNALVHDYLNVDSSIVRLVIQEQKYHFLRDFGCRVISTLRNAQY